MDEEDFNIDNLINAGIAKLDYERKQNILEELDTEIKTLTNALSSDISKEEKARLANGVLYTYVTTKKIVDELEDF